MEHEQVQPKPKRGRPLSKKKTDQQTVEPQPHLAARSAYVDKHKNMPKSNERAQSTLCSSIPRLNILEYGQSNSIPSVTVLNSHIDDLWINDTDGRYIVTSPTIV